MNGAILCDKLEKSKKMVGCNPLLRKCKGKMVAFLEVRRYNETITRREANGMKLADKIVDLRKSKGVSQEELAERLGVSRQAVSRWENGSAMPDAANLLQLSKLFGVTADYLLNDDYQSDEDLPKLKQTRQDTMAQFTIYMLILEVMILLAQFMAVVILKSVFFGAMTSLLFVAMIGGFEYAHRKNGGDTLLFRRRFYKLTTWLGVYFPIRLLMTIVTALLLPTCPANVFEVLVLAVYIGTAFYLTLTIDQKMN